MPASDAEARSAALTKALVHPLVVGAVLVLIVNDHLLKRAMPGLITGKLSDVAGLVFFPLTLAVALAWLARRAGRRAEPVRLVASTAVLTGVVFALVKTTAVGGWWYRHGLAALQCPARVALAWLTGARPECPAEVSLTPDVTDLVALPALLVPYWLVRRVGAAAGARAEEAQANHPRLRDGRDGRS